MIRPTAHERTLIERTPKFETCISLFQRRNSLVCGGGRRDVVVVCAKNLRLDTQPLACLAYRADRASLRVY